MPKNRDAATRAILLELAERRKKYMADKIDLRAVAELNIVAQLEQDRNAYERLVVDLRARKVPVSISEIGAALGTKNRGTVYEILERQKIEIDTRLSTLPETPEQFEWVYEYEFMDYEPTEPGSSVWREVFRTAPGWNVKVTLDNWNNQQLNEDQLYRVFWHREGLTAGFWDIDILLPKYDATAGFVDIPLRDPQLLPDFWGWRHDGKERAHPLYMEFKTWLDGNPQPTNNEKED